MHFFINLLPIKYEKWESPVKKLVGLFPFFFNSAVKTKVYFRYFSQNTKENNILL